MTHPQQDNLVGGDWSSIHGIHRFAHEAMATTFEIFIQHDNAHYAQQAARAAFNELDRLEAELSRFIENSDISRINNLPANQLLRVGLDAFECLQKSLEICAETGGAFDVTVDSLTRRQTSHESRVTSDEIGMHLIKLNEADVAVELLDSPIQIDLGGIGKGFALDRMAELLHEWSINTALLHGGYSSVLALDAPDFMDPAINCRAPAGSALTSGAKYPGHVIEPSRQTRGWPVTLSNPHERKQTLANLYLRNKACSASGLQRGPHIINPQTACPVEDKFASWACADDAATADALSTAFMVMTPDEIKRYCSCHPEVLAMVIFKNRDKILRFGL